MISFQIDRRVGIVVPPSNPSVEPELRELLARNIALHATRLPVLAGDLQARLAGFLPHFGSCLTSFGDLAIAAYYIGVTGSTYASGYDSDLALCEQLSQRVGAPVRTASLAIVDSLRALDCARITLLSPYPEWLTQQSKRYWESAGIEVTHVASITNAAAPDAHVYALGSDDVAAAIARLPANADTVLMTGTGLMSLPTMLASAKSSASPLLLSSNLCGAWWLTRELKLSPSASLAAACPRLAHAR